jgi:hypothetical protein
VAIAPDLGQRAGAVGEGVVGRRAAVLAQAHHLAVVVVQGLRVVHAAKAVAQREEQVSGRGLGDAAAKVQPAATLGCWLKTTFTSSSRRRVVRQRAEASAVELPPAVAGSA